MRLLLITEKFRPHSNQRDGGARLVSTLQEAFGSNLSILQFGPQEGESNHLHFDYPLNPIDRFQRRIVNASFIGEKVKSLEQDFTHFLFIHISMQFGLIFYPLKEEKIVWTFPMFLTPSYQRSGEVIPHEYFEMEKKALVFSTCVLTPSYYEKRQLIDTYNVSKEKIHVVPRGIRSDLLSPKKKMHADFLEFCSVGSIKPQKNTKGLVLLFSEIQKKYPLSTLKIIGPIQNEEYYQETQDLISQKKLDDHIFFTGFIPPEKLSVVTQSSHFHLSASLCETFGRSIFETLALGLPNIVRKEQNAANDFLANLPYIHFVNNDVEAIKALEKMLIDLPHLSQLSREIGTLYDDIHLSKLLAAKIAAKESIAISDFDGTLFHKNDPEKTKRSFESFKKFPKRIVCSARSIHDIQEQLATHQLTVDWMIGYSGSIVADGNGTILWKTPLEDTHILTLEKTVPHGIKIKNEEDTLQVMASLHTLPPCSEFRIEVYQGMAYISHWKASKLRAVHRLLNEIRFSGNVHVFGDGPYDLELLRYYDGTTISVDINPLERQKAEVTYEEILL